MFCSNAFLAQNRQLSSSQCAGQLVLATPFLLISDLQPRQRTARPSGLATHSKSQDTLGSSETRNPKRLCSSVILISKTTSGKPGQQEPDFEVYRLDYLYQEQPNWYTDKQIIRIGGGRGLEERGRGRVLQRSLELCLLFHLDLRSLWSPVLICQSQWCFPLFPPSLQCTPLLCRSGMNGRKRMMTWTGLVLYDASFGNRKARKNQ